MNLSDFFYLGKIVKPHGIKGQLNGLIDADNPLSYSQLNSVFIQTKQGLIPYSIDLIDVESNGFCILSFREVNTIDSAKKLQNKKLFLPLSFLPKLSGNNFYFHEVKGFKVIDSNHGDIGIIYDVIESHQPLLQIMKGNKEILIPIHDDIITEIDRENKTVFVTSPEGLIEVYLDE